MTSIRRLCLHDCNSITNNGMSALLSLTALHALSLRGCRKITNNGLELIAVRDRNREQWRRVHGASRLSS
jgi:hypothetical protein